MFLQEAEAFAEGITARQQTAVSAGTLPWSPSQQRPCQRPQIFHIQRFAEEAKAADAAGQKVIRDHLVDANRSSSHILEDAIQCEAGGVQKPS
jgi:hypothetical protein